MALVKNEAPDQRRHHRSSVPIGVRIHGLSHCVTDWSLGGFRVADFVAGGLIVGERLLVQFTVVYQGLDVAFSTEIDVVRIDREKRTMAGRFVQLTAREKEVLGYAMLGPTVNGERASLIESLARIDIPVTPVSAIPTAKEAPRPSPIKLRVRRFVFTMIYLGLGLALGAVILLVLYFHFFRLDLEYSVVSLPLYPVISQDIGRCQELLVKEGDVVKQGQELFRVEDDTLTRDLEVAELQLAAAKIDLATAQGRVDKEREKNNLYLSISKDKLKSANSLVEALEIQLGQAKSQYERERTLLVTRSTSQQLVEQAFARVGSLEGQLLQAKADQRIAEHALIALKQGDFFDQRRLVGDLPQFLVNLQDAEARHKLGVKRETLARDRAKRLVYFAPFDGKVVKLLKVVGATMNRGEALAILEKAGDAPVIDGFVTQDDANSLSLGNGASIWIPALDKTVQGRIVKIDRTSGFLTEMQAHMKDSQLRYNWRGQEDRSAYVQLEIQDAIEPDIQKTLGGGMPVVVSVAKRPLFWHRIEAFVSQAR
jgi:multidrug resistance efflux pump